MASEAGSGTLVLPTPGTNSKADEVELRMMLVYAPVSLSVTKAGLVPNTMPGPAAAATWDPVMVVVVVPVEDTKVKFKLL